MATGLIGVDIDDFRTGTREALAEAAKLKFRAVEMSMAHGALSPPALSQSGRRHLARHVRGLGFEFAAIVGDLPASLRLTDPASTQEVVDRTRALLMMAADMRVPIVTAGVRALTHPKTGDPSPQAVDALRQIGMDADTTGTIFALRPSDDPPERLMSLLSQLGCPSLRVCLDPAAMVMAGNDPTDVFRLAPDSIVLSHARDGTVGTAERAGAETPLGEGGVDWVGYLAMLEATDYHGPQIIRRRNSARPMTDILDAREFLENNLLQP